MVEFDFSKWLTMTRAERDELVMISTRHAQSHNYLLGVAAERIEAGDVVMMRDGKIYKARP